jgi:hypothetical protein
LKCAAVVAQTLLARREDEAALRDAVALAGRTVASSSRRVVYGGVVHLTIRLAEGTLTLTPERHGLRAARDRTPA